jgi:hypothetical protein
MIKLYLKEIPHRCGIILDAYLNIGNIYEGELCPVIYDPYKSSSALVWAALEPYKSSSPPAWALDP